VPVRKSSRPRPRCIVIAGPNGAGKTTFAREFLPKERIIRFVNADSIATGLSPLRPDLVNVAAGRLFLKELDRKLQGFEIEIIFLSIRSANLAVRRILARVEQGGHNVPRRDVLRRFARSTANFEHIYKHLADRWTLYDNSGRRPVILKQGP